VNGNTEFYSYDDGDKLLSAGLKTYTYNGFDTRVGKTIGGSTTSYHHDEVGVTAPLISASDATYTSGVSALTTAYT
jgi:hypothetical protein